MEFISLTAAATLTEWSERTFWRRFKDGAIKRELHNGKAVVQFRAIAANACIPLDDAAVALVAQADAGNATAQTDLALLFLENRRPKGALAWLELAAKQDHGNAMYLLGAFLIAGDGGEKDENLGLMWVCKAASHQNSFATAVLQSIFSKLSHGN